VPSEKGTEGENLSTRRGDSLFGISEEGDLSSCKGLFLRRGRRKELVRRKTLKVHIEKEGRLIHLRHRGKKKKSHPPGETEIAGLN